MLAIIQARLSSKRLPSKVLKDINGEPIIMHVFKRVSQAKLVNEIVIATSNEKSDNNLIKFLEKNKISFYIGSLKNVAQRMLSCAEESGARKFIRINGDSPLIDPKIIDKAVLLSNKDDYDLCTNVLFRSFPKGQSVEIINTQTLKNNINKFSIPEQEHVTKFFYNNHEKFKIKNFKSNNNHSRVQLSIDTKFDFEIIKKIICEGNEKIGWKEAAKKAVILMEKNYEK